jgi:hypothetical protein
MTEGMSLNKMHLLQASHKKVVVANSANAKNIEAIFN